MTPYGYRIANGTAVVVPEEADAVRELFLSYLDGMSVRKSARKAGIQRGVSCVWGMLQNPVYTGTDFYPQIVEPRLFEAVQFERRKRDGPDCRHRRTLCAVPVQYKFRLPLCSAEKNSAAALTEYIYQAIEAGEGKEFSNTANENTNHQIRLMFQNCISNRMGRKETWSL